MNTILIGTPGGYDYAYSGFTGPASLGTGGTTAASSGTGDLFGIDDLVLYVPEGYAGLSLTGSSTFDNTTIAALGFTTGTYVFTWPDPGSVTVNVSAGVPEPSTWAMMLLGFAGLGFAGYRSRKSVAPAA